MQIDYGFCLIFSANMYYVMAMSKAIEAYVKSH